MMRQWTDYDVSNMTVFLGDLALWRPAVLPPPTPVPPPATPTLPGAEDTRWKAAKLAVTANLRKAAGVSADIITEIKSGSTVAYIVPEPPVTVSGYTWLYVKAGDDIGYMALLRSAVSDQFVTVPDGAARRKARREALKLIAQGFDTLAQGFQALMLLEELDDEAVA